MSSWKRNWMRAVATVGVLLLFLVGSTPTSPVADAAFSSCRADPIVYLSDGTTLIVTVDVDTDVSNITIIGYSIHAPHGVKMLSVEHTPLPGFTGKEQFAFNDDAKPNQFLTDTVVQLHSMNGVRVVATTTRKGVTKSVTGLNARHLKATLGF